MDDGRAEKGRRRLQAAQGAARAALRRSVLRKKGDRDGLHLRDGRRRQPLYDPGRPGRGRRDEGRAEARRQLQPVLASSTPTTFPRPLANPPPLAGEGRGGAMRGREVRGADGWGLGRNYGRAASKKMTCSGTRPGSPNSRRSAPVNPS